MKVKVAYILSDVSYSPAFIWIAKGIDKDKIDLQFIFLNPGPSKLEELISDLDISTYRIPLFGKKDYPGAWLRCYKLLKSMKPDIIHCHLFDANLIGLSAGIIAGVKRRIHTRHHGDLHHVSFSRGVWLDKLVNSLSTDVVAPSDIARRVLVEMDHIKEEKVKVIHHGFMFSDFTNVSQERIQNLKLKYGFPDNASPVIGVISRWTEWKGVHITIRAFKLLLNDQPQALLVLANAGGDYEKEILQLLHELPDESYRVVDFEEDVAALYKTFDLFVHVPIRETAEAFGQTYIEAICASIPSIFTRSGVFADFPSMEGFQFVNHEDPSDIYGSFEISIPSPQVSQQFKEEFEVSNLIHRLDQLYTES